MKKILLFLSLLAAAFNALAVTADEVTVQQVEGIKVVMDKGCRDAGAKRGYLPEKLNLICGCAGEAAEVGLSFGQWQELYVYSRTNQKDKAATMHEALRPAIKECIENATRKRKAAAADTAKAAP